MKRRNLLIGVAALAGLALVARRSGAYGRSELAVTPADQGANGEIERLELSDAEWRERLTDAQYRVLRREGTERPYSSPLNDETREGEYLCAGCGLLLFRSEWKYDSRTGWPSFFDVVEAHIGTKRDYKLILPRTEYHCARCGGHHGHVFEDGPEPTGLRYCNNGVALEFRPV